MSRGCFTDPMPKKLEDPKTPMYYTVVKEGAGAFASRGTQAHIFYTCSYRDGTLLESCYETGDTLSFIVGVNHVPAGIDLATHGMRIGEIRRATVTPFMGLRRKYPEYMSRDSVLIYMIELMDVREDPVEVEARMIQEELDRAEQAARDAGTWIEEDVPHVDDLPMREMKD
jgi:hypothetical protein